MKERQELWCHGCSRYVQFDIDTSLEGDHVIICPNCKHEHCRVVRNGIITEVRWGSRNGMGSYMATGLTTSSASTYTTYNANTMTDSSSGAITYGAWMNLTTNS